MERALSATVIARRSGGAHTSRTIMLAEATELFAAVPPSGPAAELKAAAVDENVTGKNTLAGRMRTHRYLREMYALDPTELLYRALRDLWDLEPSDRPLLLVLCALARDPVLHATLPAILETPPGTPVSSADLAAALEQSAPGAYREVVAAKIGRNTAGTWTKTGHLRGRTNKVRATASPGPCAVAYALLLGHLDGARGEVLFETTWARVLDRPKDALMELALRASQRGLIEYKAGGGVVEVGFRMLLRPFEGESGE